MPHRHSPNLENDGATRRRLDRFGENLLCAGSAEHVVDEFAVSIAELGARLAQPAEALALVGERLLFPRTTVNFAFDLGSARVERASVGDQKGRIHATDLHHEGSYRGGCLDPRHPTGVI